MVFLVRVTLGLCCVALCCAVVYMVICDMFVAAIVLAGLPPHMWSFIAAILHSHASASKVLWPRTQKPDENLCLLIFGLFFGFVVYV